MKFKYTINTDSPESHVCLFLQNKNFVFYKINDFLLLRENKFFLIDYGTEIDVLKKNLATLKNKKIKTILILPSKFKNQDYVADYVKIFYPIMIKRFEDFVENYFKSEILEFKDVVLENNNFVLNKNNMKKIYLTETEIEILKLLIIENTVEKGKLKTEILNVQSNLNTKSLESHLSRIRKKLQEINSIISIVSLENHCVVIS